jgi:tetratricopeptide (TPR) repeat protein
MATSVSGSTDVQEALNRIGTGATKNARAVGAGAAVLLVVLGVAAFFTSQRQNRAEEAKNALYLAQKNQEKELRAFAEAQVPQTKPAPTAKNAKEAPKAPSAPADPGRVAFAKFDVDARLPETVKQLQKVVQDFDGTRAAHEARLSLGGLYVDHGEAAKALPWFEKAVSSAPNTTERAFALNALGFAQEGAGKFTDAFTSFEKALNAGGAENLKGDLLLNMARVQAAAGDAAKARGVYDRIISEMPDTEYARTAEQLKTQLQ